LYEFLAWLEASAWGEAMRTSGVWTYAVVNLTHILGVSSLFGAMLLLDLRLVGLWRSIPLEALERPVVPVAAAGFIVAAVSGFFMISTNATDYYDNPFIFIKFSAIALAILNVAALNVLPAWKARRRRALAPHEHRQLAAAGAVSLAAWLTAIGAARLIGYW
jgi:hypothetical protein